MKITPRILLLSTAVVALGIVFASHAHATIVFKDDFNRDNNTVIGSTPGPGTGTWTETHTTIPAAAVDGDIAINNNQIVVTHGANDAIYQLGVPTSGFLSPWPASNKLSDAPGKVTWTVNMQSSRTNLSGVAPGANGIGVALVATNTNFGAIGNNGYALVWGQTSTPDPIHLVSFTGDGALGTIAPIISGSGTPFGNVAAEYLSIRVEYDPATNTWELFGRNDGASAFADPSTGGGFTSLGTAVNSLHTGLAMGNVGFFGSYTTVGPSNIYRHDNFAIDVVPEPSSVVLAGISLLGLGAVVCRRKLA